MGTVPPEHHVERLLTSNSDETNERLDRLIAEQQRTNELLEWLGGLIAAASDKPPRETPTVRTSSVARRIDRHIELE